METIVVYRTKISLPTFEADNIKVIESGIESIVQHQDTAANLDLVLCIKFVTRKLQWLGMQEKWTERMQDEFVMLDKLNENFKDQLKNLDNGSK